MLAQTDFQHIAGTRVAMDFVEVPSILMEYFAKMPDVLASIGVHYKTKQHPPLELIQSQLSRTAISEAYETQSQVQMALLDQAYHSSQVFQNFDSSQMLYDLSRRIK